MSCWRCTTPLGKPVEPEEYSQKHASSLEVAAASSVEAARESHASKPICAPLGLPATTTCLRWVARERMGPASARSGSEMTATLARLSFRKYR